MVIGLAGKLNLKKKLIKCFDSDDWKKYNHERYEHDKAARLKYQKEYYKKHREEILAKADKRYRKKCGLGIKNENCGT